MAVAIDATMTGGNSPDGLNQEASGTTSISSTGITVGASATGLVAALVWQDPVAGTGSAPATRAVTWNGVAMTEAAFVTSSVIHTVSVGIYVLANPAAGAQTLSATWTNTQDAYLSAVSFTGTDTSTVVNATDSTTTTQTTSITVTSDTNGATVAVFGVDGSAPTVNFTKIFSDAPLAPGGGASYTLGGTSNGHTFTGSGGGTQALAGVHVIAGAGGGGGGAAGVAGAVVGAGYIGLVR
jgi:hypothetical protein